ncbi:MAG: hypothetical protein ABIA04_12405 [Pseudomonadota bacterium]
MTRELFYTICFIIITLSVYSCGGSQVIPQETTVIDVYEGGDGNGNGDGDGDGDGNSDGSDYKSFSMCLEDASDADANGISDCMEEYLSQNECDLLEDCDNDGILSINEILPTVYYPCYYYYSIDNATYNSDYASQCANYEEYYSESLISYTYYYYDDTNEYNYGFSISDPMNLNSDNDGLSDFEEAELYLDPLSDDTDGDEISDSSEINGYYENKGIVTSPNYANTDGEDYNDKLDIDYDLNPSDNDIPNSLEACMSSQDSEYYSDGYGGLKFSFNAVADKRYYALKIYYSNITTNKYTYAILDIDNSDWGFADAFQSSDVFYAESRLTDLTDDLYSYYYCTYTDDSLTVSCYLDNYAMDSLDDGGDAETDIYIALAIYDDDSNELETNFSDNLFIGSPAGRDGFEATNTCLEASHAAQMSLGLR